MTTGTVERQYVPEIGRRVKLANFFDYSAQDIPTWAWLEVLSVMGGTVKAEVLNGDTKTGARVSIPLHVIDKPLGWEPRYTIHVKADEVDKVLGWFNRGIAVWQSHDLNPYNMPKAFTPLDKPSPGWRFPERTDAIKPDECAKLIRVIRFDELECPELRDLKGKEKQEKIAAYLADGWKAEYVRLGRYDSYWKRVKETIVHDWQ